MDNSRRIHAPIPIHPVLNPGAMALSNRSRLATDSAVRRIPPETQVSVVMDDQVMDDQRHQMEVQPLALEGCVESRLPYDDDPIMGNAINVRPDIGLSDQELILLPTKSLNKLIKKKGLSKQRAKEIKQERRTLKNRGYAANCRVKRDEEEEKLRDDISTIDNRIEELKREIEAANYELKNVAQRRVEQVRSEIREEQLANTA